VGFFVYGMRGIFGCEKEFIMKRLLLIVLPLLLIVVCSKPLDDESLIDRGGVKYQQDSQKPYSGKVVRLYENGEKNLKVHTRMGKKMEYGLIGITMELNMKGK